jgi:hypothetical protein
MNRQSNEQLVFTYRRQSAPNSMFQYDLRLDRLWFVRQLAHIDNVDVDSPKVIRIDRVRSIVSMQIRRAFLLYHDDKIGDVKARQRVIVWILV